MSQNVLRPGTNSQRYNHQKNTVPTVVVLVAAIGLHLSRWRKFWTATNTSQFSDNLHVSRFMKTVAQNMHTFNKRRLVIFNKLAQAQKRIQLRICGVTWSRLTGNALNILMDLEYIFIDRDKILPCQHTMLILLPESTWWCINENRILKPKVSQFILFIICNHLLKVGKVLIWGTWLIFYTCHLHRSV